MKLLTVRAREKIVINIEEYMHKIVEDEPQFYFMRGMEYEQREILLPPFFSIVSISCEKQKLFRLD